VTYLIRHPIVALLVLAFMAAVGTRTVMAREKHKSTPKESPALTSDPATNVTNSDYKDLLSRNLFARDQRRRRYDPREIVIDHETANELARSRENAKEASTNKGEADIVLMGIVEKDGVGSAFLEDRRAGKSITAKTGDAIAGGKVGTITLHAMEFILGDKTTNITLGNNLQGGVSTAKPLDPTTSSTASTDTKGGAGAVDDATLSIIEKLRKKRLKEMNK